MKVILTERVKSLGNTGEIVKVAEGFGRNYLIPRRLAVLADAASEAQVKNQQKSLMKKLDKEKNEAEVLAKKINGVNLEFSKVVGGSGKLFGTITNAELSNALLEKGFEVERRLIHVEIPIKALGTFEAKAKLFHNVVATFNVKVSMDAAQALELKEKHEMALKNKKEKKTKEVVEVVAETETTEEA
jgi:large subunit ribosomal protein L9